MINSPFYYQYLTIEVTNYYQPVTLEVTNNELVN